MKIKPEKIQLTFYSGFNFTTAFVLFITGMIIHIFIPQSAVQMHVIFMYSFSQTRTTLVNRLGGRVSYDHRKGPPSVLTKNEENQSADWLIELGNRYLDNPRMISLNTYNYVVNVVVGYWATNELCRNANFTTDTKLKP